MQVGVMTPEQYWSEKAKERRKIIGGFYLCYNEKNGTLVPSDLAQQIILKLQIIEQMLLEEGLRK